ncbi:hypothetical protein PAXRUDRAFT_792298 [Paxillus rubicundulus Ve08.2h10]|uniref:Uncharacterized protein n=1 Tax=Paxillus rubicundulus Ve08.2h10 TaxID=930991 RepID=A0A0D0CST6_9AGAM|nr:hypothetical protein PAXRUDRAFT_792298 [Paxillus rubicundulus Ve08.2h10]
MLWFRGFGRRGTHGEDGLLAFILSAVDAEKPKTREGDSSDERISRDELGIEAASANRKQEDRLSARGRRPERLSTTLNRQHPQSCAFAGEGTFYMETDSEMSFKLLGERLQRVSVPLTDTNGSSGVPATAAPVVPAPVVPVPVVPAPVMLAPIMPAKTYARPLDSTYGRGWATHPCTLAVTQQVNANDAMAESL